MRFEYQADVKRMWEDDLGPEARVQFEGNDTALIENYLQDSCRANWKKRSS